MTDDQELRDDIHARHGTWGPDDLGRLQELRDDILAARGTWGADDLADACAEAAAVPSFGGDPGELRAIAEYCATVARSVSRALDAAEPLRDCGFSQVRVGDTRLSVNEALRTLTDDMCRALRAFRAVGCQLSRHAEQVQSERLDSANAGSLAEIAATAGTRTPGAEGEVRAQHAKAIAGIDARVAVHVAMRDAAEDFAIGLHEVEAQARTGRRSDRPTLLHDEGPTGDRSWTIAQDVDRSETIAEPVPRA